MEELTDSGGCAVCGNDCTKRCVKCMQIYYCSREHQVEHWSRHKNACHPVKVVSLEGCDRKALIATRDIPQGEIMLKEKPLLTGPRAMEQYPDRFPLCLECYRIVQGNYRCTKCFWPVCNPRCQMGRNHSENECNIFMASGVSPGTSWQEYLSVCVLRGLMLKERDNSKWMKLLQLESTMDYFGSFETTFQPMLEFIQVECGQTQYDSETIKFVAGALQVNRMSDENSNESSDPFGSFLFHKANFASHSCVPNSMWFIQSSSDLYLRASVNIQKGESVTCTNVPMEGGTLARRATLEIYGISCSCKRCTDPTELGTYMSAVKCQNSNCDDITGYFLAQTPTSMTSDWKCVNSACGYVKSATEIQQIVGKIQNEFDTMMRDWQAQRQPDLKFHLERIKKAETFLRKYEGKVLHKNHSIMFVCKKELSSKIPQLAPHIENDTQRMDLEGKQVGWAKECLELADTFWPGYSRYRGQLLYNLQRGMFCLIFSEVEHLGKSRRNRAYNAERVAKLREAFMELLTFRREVKVILGIEADSKVEKHRALEMDQEGQDFQMIRRVLQI